MELKEHFITVERPYREGNVEGFRQRVPGRKVKKATLSITALGLYEARLDGKKVGDAIFTPGFTFYPRQLQYQTYDVTQWLREDSVLTVYLAQGWYCGRYTFDNKTQIYGERPAVSWILTVESGEEQLHYCSDDPEVESIETPYAYAGFYDGEIYHADGFRQELFPPVKFTGMLPETLERGEMCVRVREELTVRTATVRNGVTILDFGQNFAGFVEIDPSLMEGTCLRLRHGEILNADGSLYTANLRKAKAEIVYEKGTKTEKYRPAFTYMGFRYAELSGVPYRQGLITAYATYSDMERTGSFHCENALVQKLYENQLWGQKSNYVEVPTDCPQRDERMGYTGDGQVFARTGMYNFDTEMFWRKFLKDIRYSQTDNTEGYVATVIPAAPGKQGIGFMSMLGWGNCVCIVPELLYRHFGTDEYLREQYESMKTFVECELRHTGGLLGKKNLWIAPSLGDWLAMGRDVKFMAMHNGPVSNAFLINDLRIMAWAAGYLGRAEDAARYTAQLEKSREAYLKAFVRADGSMKDDYQGAYILALQMVIPRGEIWNRTFAHLVARIRADGMQTGFFATEYILPMLADNGEAELAYDLLLQENCPGWMYQVKAGATTTWERWDALRPDGTVNETKMSTDNMVSFNHYAFGSVGEFYYRYILGIEPLEPGFRSARIRPIPDARLGKVSGSYRSRSGEIRVSWDAKTRTMEVTSPVAGEWILPNGETRTLAPGTSRASW